MPKKDLPRLSLSTIELEKCGFALVDKVYIDIHFSYDTLTAYEKNSLFGDNSIINFYY